MAIYEIPLIAAPQTLAISLAGATYSLTLQYHEANAGVVNAPTGADGDTTGLIIDENNLDGWTLDISDGSGNPLVCGIPLIPGIDLLGQYEYLNIGGTLRISVDGDKDGIPNFAGLGTSGHLWFTV